MFFAQDFNTVKFCTSLRVTQPKKISFSSAAHLSWHGKISNNKKSLSISLYFPAIPFHTTASEWSGKKEGSFDGSADRRRFSKGSALLQLHMKHCQLRLKSFLYDKTWGFLRWKRSEQGGAILINLFSSGFAHWYWQGTGIIASNSWVRLSAVQSYFTDRNRGSLPLPRLIWLVSFLLCSVHLISFLLCVPSFV